MRRPLTTKRLEGFFGVLAVYGALTVLMNYNGWQYTVGCLEAHGHLTILNW